MRYGLFLILTLLALPSHARMYQWVNTESGTTQLSGKPPSWYRGLAQGPRVIVFEKGMIVDDTATQVPEWQRKRLRAEAFGLSLSEVPDDASRLKDLAQKLKEIADSEEFLGSLVEQAQAPDPNKEESTQSVVDQLKAVISAWDKQKAEQATAPVHDRERTKSLPIPNENSYPSGKP